MVQEKPGNTDGVVAELAQRHPLILRDVGEWARLHPDATKFNPIRTKAASARCGERDLLLNTSGEDALSRLDDGRSVLHLFPRLSSFLHFLAQPEAQDCARHESWTPLLLLPLQHAMHTQSLLSKIHPHDWPWALLDHKHFDDDAVAAEAKALGQQLAQWLKSLEQRAVESLAPRYSGRPTPAQVLDQKQRPLRVLAVAMEGSSYQQFCARDVAEAFDAQGAQAKALIARISPATNLQVLEAIADFDPDVLFLNGRHRTAFVGLPRELCVLSWDQDHALVSSPNYAKEKGERDRLMVMVREWAEHARHVGVDPEKTAYVNLGTNTRIYHPPAKRLDEEYDVLFVGNYYPWDAYRKVIQFDALDARTQELMLLARQKLSQWVLTRGEDEQFVIPDCSDLLKQSLNELGYESAGDAHYWRFVVHYFRYRVAHLLVRELYLSSLAEFRLGLFGRGWEQIPALAKHARPEIENGAPLREAIHRSAINVHLHTWTVHHPRLYDTAAAGGFLLVGQVPEEVPLSKVFEPHRELDVFSTIAQLKEKVRYYLAHPEERRTIAARAAERAGRDHTMEKRMGEAIEFLKRGSDA